MSDLENMTLLELRNFAKEHNIKNISKLNKEECEVKVINPYFYANLYIYYSTFDKIN